MSMNRQTISTVGTPEIENEIDSSSRTFRYWDKTPWTLSSKTSIMLAKIDNLVVTFVKTVEIATDIRVVYGTILANQSALGFKSQYNNIQIKLRLFNNADGLIEEWAVVANHSITCLSQNEPISFKTNFKPDLFDLIEKVKVIIEPATWLACGH
jgi:hypothetical protein